MGKLIPIRSIAESILIIRNQKVMLSQDLAGLYGVPVKALNQAVKRHSARFPAPGVAPGDRVHRHHTDVAACGTLGLDLPVVVPVPAAGPALCEQAECRSQPVA